MTKIEAIATSKQFRKDADELLQRMKEFKGKLEKDYVDEGQFLDFYEVGCQHVVSIRDLESCIMRQGMVLKYIGNDPSVNPNPYPTSYNPKSSAVEPTADGLKM